MPEFQIILRRSVRLVGRITPQNWVKLEGLPILYFKISIIILRLPNELLLVILALAKVRPVCAVTCVPVVRPLNPTVSDEEVQGLMLLSLGASLKSHTR